MLNTESNNNSTVHNIDSMFYSSLLNDIDNLLIEFDVAYKFTGNGSNKSSIEGKIKVLNSLTDRLKSLTTKLCSCVYEPSMCSHGKEPILVNICDTCKDKKTFKNLLNKYGLTSIKEV